MGILGINIGDGSGFPGVATTVDVLDGNFHHIAGTLGTAALSDSIWTASFKALRLTHCQLQHPRFEYWLCVGRGHAAALFQESWMS